MWIRNMADVSGSDGMATKSADGELAWRKARSSIGNGACVEVASMNGMVALRDSKDPNGTILKYSVTEWHAFLVGAKKGDFDHR
jgi:hypothetical protein